VIVRETSVTRQHSSETAYPITDFDEIRTLELPPPENHQPCKISYRSNDVGGLDEYPICHCLCLSFFGLLVTRTGRTGDLILTIYMSYDVSPPKDVPFGSFVDMPPHLGGQISPKRQFWGRKQAFSSLTRKILKLAYYQNYCIHPNQILHSDKDHQMPFVGGPVTRTTNPRWWMAAILAPSWKNQKICMSAMV